MTAARVVEASAARAAGSSYAAFISYSRAVDGRLAPRLESALERFAKPWYRLRVVRVFRDDADLSASPGLWSSLANALGHAQFFVLLGSPGAAASPWVAREVEYWLENRDPARLLIVLTDGDIAWDDRAGDFDWERTTALPRALAGAFEEEPRYTDMRFAATSEDLSLRDPRFRAAVADVAAPLHGRPKDELIGEELRQHRRTLRIARAAGASLAILTVVASVAAVLAVRSADRANRERDRAEHAARVATSRQLAAQSAVALGDGELGAALAQAGAAWRTAGTVEARDALLMALKGAPGVDAVAQGPPTQLAAFSGDRRRLALLGSDNRVTVIHLASRRAVGPPLRIRIPAPGKNTGVQAAVPTGLALDAHGSELAVGYSDGSVDLWGLARRRARALAGATPDDGGPVPVPSALPVFATSRRLLAWGGPGDRISIWDGERVRRLRTSEPAGDYGWEVAVSADGRFLAAAGAGSSRILLWRLGSGVRKLPGRPPLFAGVGVGEHGAIALGAGARPVLAVGGADDGRVDLWDAATGRRLRVLKLHRGRIDGLAFSPRGRMLAVVDPRAITLFGPGGERIAAVPATGAERGATPLDDRGRLVTVGASGAAVIRTPAVSESQIERRLVGAYYLTPFAFDPTSRRIAALDARMRLRLWSTSGGRPLVPPLSGPVDANRLVFLPDGNLMTCCGFSGDPTPRLWDPGGGGERDVQIPPGRGSVNDATVTADGRLVIGRLSRKRFFVSGAGRTLAIWSGLYGGGLSPDGRWAVIATDAGVDLWSVDRRRRTASIPGLSGLVAFSPSGVLVATSSDSSPIRLFDRSTGRAVGSLSNGLDAQAMAFSADGRTLATLATRHGTSGSSRTALELWDVTGRKQVGEEPLFEQEGTAGSSELAFAPDGRKLVVRTGDASLVFDIDVDAWAARACSLAASCRG